MKAITGTFLGPDGTPAAGAIVQFILNQNANCSYGLLVHESVTVVLDSTGSLPEGFELIANDEFYTVGTYYIVTLHDPVYGVVLYEDVVIAGESPVNLQRLTPIYLKAS